MGDEGRGRYLYRPRFRIYCFSSLGGTKESGSLDVLTLLMQASL